MAKNRRKSLLRYSAFALLLALAITAFIYFRHEHSRNEGTRGQLKSFPELLSGTRQSEFSRSALKLLNLVRNITPLADHIASRDTAKNRGTRDDAVPEKAPPSIEELVRNDDPCGVASGLKNDPDRVMEAIASLAEVSDMFDHPANETRELNQFLRSFSDPLNAGLAPSPDEGSSVVLRYFNALSAGDLIHEYKNEDYDYQLARRLFEELKAEHPDNAVFAFMLAAVRERLGEPRPALKAEFLAAFSAGHFDPLWSRVARRIHERSLQNSAALIASLALMHILPPPDYLPSLTLVESLVKEEDAGFRQAALEFGRMLIRQGRANDRIMDEIIGTNLDPIVGQGIAKAAWRSLHPGSPYPEDIASEIDATADQKQGINEVNEGITNVKESAPGVCNRGKLDTFIIAERKRYSEFLEKSGLKSLAR